jgi:hypothetical protein
LHLVAGSGNDDDPKIALFALHSAVKGERHRASALGGITSTFRRDFAADFAADAPTADQLCNL